MRAIFGRSCCKVQGSCHHEPRTPSWMLPDASGHTQCHTAGPTGTYMLVAPHIKRLNRFLKAKKEKGRTDRTTLRWVTPSSSSTMGVLAQIWVDSCEQVRVANGYSLSPRKLRNTSGTTSGALARSHWTTGNSPCDALSKSMSRAGVKRPIYVTDCTFLRSRSS